MKKRGLAPNSLRALQKHRELRHLASLRKYEKSPRKCKTCEKPIPYSSRLNKFCSLSCAAKYNNTRRILPKPAIKKRECFLCGKTIEASVNTPPKNIFCNECKEKRKLEKRSPRQCLICGETILSPRLYCNNPICRWASHNGLIPLRKLGARLELLGSHDFLSNVRTIADSLHDQYLDGKSSNMISNECGVHDMTVLKIIKMFYPDFSARTYSEALSNAIYNGRLNNSNRFHCGWHRTWDGKNVFLRSSCEFDFAYSLDKKKVLYDTECLRIPYIDADGANRIYIPDFYLSGENKIVEIKGEYFMNDNVYLKLRACKKLGYKTELRIY